MREQGAVVMSIVRRLQLKVFIWMWQFLIHEKLIIDMLLFLCSLQQVVIAIHEIRATKHLFLLAGRPLLLLLDQLA